MEEGRVHRFRSSLGRAGLGKACRPPNECNCISACRRHIIYDRRGVDCCTSGTSSFSACDETASVVTARFDRGTNACLSDAARLVLKALLNMIVEVAVEGSYQEGQLQRASWDGEHRETGAKVTFSEAENFRSFYALTILYDISRIAQPHSQGLLIVLCRLVFIVSLRHYTAVLDEEQVYLW